MIFHQSLIRLRARTVVDRGGNEVKDWANPDRHPLEGLHVQPLYQREPAPDADRTPTVTGWRVYTPVGSGDLDINADDRVEHEGIVCEVVGEIARWPHPLWGGTTKVEFTIQRAKG